MRIQEYYYNRWDEMRELVGYCKDCQKEIYCLDGFLNGVILDDKTIICYSCEQLKKDE